MSLARILRSFRYAFLGIHRLWKSECNVRIQVGFVVIGIALGLALNLSALEWAIVFLAMGLVICAEAMNTALELLADALRPEPSPLIGQAKDVAAGAVLLSAFAAVLAGLCVFGPRLWHLLAELLSR